MRAGVLCPFARLQTLLKIISGLHDKTLCDALISAHVFTYGCLCLVQVGWPANIKNWNQGRAELVTKILGLKNQALQDLVKLQDFPLRSGQSPVSDASECLCLPLQVVLASMVMVNLCLPTEY